MVGVHRKYRIKTNNVLVMQVDHKGQLLRHCIKSQATISLDFAYTINVYTVNSMLFWCSVTFIFIDTERTCTEYQT